MRRLERTLMTTTHVFGRVQGVFFRDWTVPTARQLGLAGWVRNLPDGTVEAQLPALAKHPTAY